MTARRQTSATDLNNQFASGSGIPLPQPPKRRADPMPQAGQPPYNRMRMSIAGGAGPSRPVQQQPLAVPTPAAQYAPRASMMGSGGAQHPPGANPLLMTVRKDAGQFGKTPLKASVRRGVPSTVRPGYLGPNLGPLKEPRPLRDKQYLSMMQHEVLEYLTERRCQIPGLSLKTVAQPTNRDFHLIFQFLVLDIDPDYIFGREKKPEEEIMMILRDLRYPLVDTISRTSLSAPGGSNAWPTLLAMLHWIVTQAQEIPKWSDPTICHDYNLVPVSEIPLDADIPNFPALITCDYIFNAYSQYMYGKDEFPEQDEALEAIIDSKNEAVIKRCDEKEMRVARLKRDIETLQSTPGELVELDKDYVNLQKQLTSFKAYIAEKDAKITEYQQVGSHIKGHIATAEEEIAKLNLEHEQIIARIAEQGLSVEEVQQMATDRDNLKRILEDLRPKSAEAARAMGEVEIAVQKRVDVVDQVLTRYTTLLYDTALVPTAPEPFTHINFKMDLNTAVANPADMLKGDLRGTVHPALNQMAELRSKERVDLENQKFQADEELDVLTQQCHKMEEEAEPSENQLRVLSKKIEELRMTVAGETAAANAEAGKLERDLGKIEAEVEQSDRALQSRKQRLDVEYKEVVRKTEQLKEETRKKITFECQQMLNFKQDVTKELEELVLFARDN